MLPFMFSITDQEAKQRSRKALKPVPGKCKTPAYRGIFADVSVYIFAHLHMASRTECLAHIQWQS